VGPNQAPVTWSVSDDGTTVSSWVDYGLGSGNYTLTTPRRSGTGPQSAVLTDLRSCTMYSYRIKATDGLLTATKDPNPPVFYTNGSTPTITNIAVVNVLDTSMTIRWNLTGPADTQSRVEYGTTSSLGSSTPLLTGTGPRSATISGLVQDTNYNFRIYAQSPCGNANSNLQVQRTALVVHVKIENPAGLGAYFNPGSPGRPWGSAGNDPMPPGGRPLVFEIRNMDNSPHSWYIQGVTPAYGSTTITGGATYLFPASIVLNTGQTYHMKSAYAGDSAMDGTITPT